jgi:hypothetical protein
MESPLLPVIMRSSTYINTTSLWVESSWINKEEFVVLLVEPKSSGATLNLACQARELCFSPYIDLWSLQTSVELPFWGCSRGSFRNTSSSRSPCQNAFLTSIWQRNNPWLIATDRRTLTIVILATGANVSL